MNPVFTIVNRECKSVLRSPISWCVFAGYTALVGLLFTAALRSNDNSFEHVPAIFCIQLFLGICIPIGLFTMRLFAEEKAHGTLEMLMTSPVSDTQVVMGKFLSSFILVVMAIAMAFLVFPVYMSYATPPAIYSEMSMYGGIFVVLLLAASWCAIGTFFSLLSYHQTVSAAATVVVVLSSAAAFTGNIPGFDPSGICDAVDFSDAARGTLDSRIIFGSLSTTFLFLFSSIRVLESRRWCRSKKS